VEFLQFVHRLGGRLDNIEQPFVRADFKLVHRLFVDVRGTIHRELLDQSRQRNRAGHAGAGALGRFDDVDGRLIEHAMIECFQANAYALSVGHKIISLSGRGWPRRGFAEPVQNGMAPSSSSSVPWKANGWRWRSRRARPGARPRG